MKRALWIAFAVSLLGAGAAVGVNWVLREREVTKPPVPEAYVGTLWPVVRNAPGHEVHVGRLQQACTTCHAASDGGLDRPAAEACVSCHAQETRIDHASQDAGALELGDAAAGTQPDAQPTQPAAPQVLSRCTDCHSFGKNVAQMPTDCISCHRAPQGLLTAVSTHATAPCTECHQVHDNTTRAKDCTACHAVSVKHGHGGADVATQCRVCHDVHSNVEVAQDKCLSCHGLKGKVPVPHTAVFTNGHACASCHRPHEFAKQSVTACRSCHDEVHPLAGHERQGCTGCHQPHAVRAQIEGGAVCTTCHKDVALSHADKHAKDLGACVGCHVPHPPKQQQGPQACSSCHADIGGSTHNAHAQSLSCTNCHAPHAFHLELDIGLCRNCHAPQVNALQKRSEHKECTSCHQGLPHALDAPVAPCGSCHREIQAKVHQGHAECRQCHQPHQASVQLASCEHCHARETKQHPRGHDQCMQCHDQHVKAPKPGVADCSACHKKKQLSGLHLEPKHTVDGCQTCHAPHGLTPPGDRQLCLNCHEDRVQHQPEPTRCDGCHTFIGVRPGRSP